MHFLKGIKVSFGFSSNIRNLVSMKDSRLNDLKSYDHHILMQQLLPIVIRGILPVKVWNVIHKLCVIFASLFAKILDHSSMNDLQEHIVVVLCQLEIFRNNILI